MSAPAGSPASEGTQTAPQRKPRFAIFVATAGGLGYLPKAPGTFGSLGGIVLACLPWWVFVAISAAYLNFRRGDAAVFVRVGSRFSQDPFLSLGTGVAFTPCRRCRSVEREPGRSILGAEGPAKGRYR